MMEIWNEFCSYLIDCKERGVTEERYHEIIESQLSLFGWKRFKGEICHKERIPSGHGFAEPDIVIKKDGIYQMVIEVKKPNHLQTKEERLQLLSYMRLCTLRVGIYIGEHIEIFYDVQGDSTEPVSIYKIPISLNEERGQQFVELIRRDIFDKNRLIEFCDVQLQEKKKQESLNLLKGNLLNGNYDAFLKDCLKQRINEEDCFSVSESQIDHLLSTLQIKIVSKEVEQYSENVPVAYPPTSSVPNEISVKRDNTRFSLDGSMFLPKNKFALAIVRKYTRLHPEKNFDELLRVFPDRWQGSMGVIKQLGQITPKQIQDRRYSTSPEDILRSGDGVQFAVTTQWNITTIQNMIDFAKSQGWNVKANK